MSGILAGIGGWISGKIGAISIGAAIPLAFMILKKQLPKYFGNLVFKGLDKGMDDIGKIADPKRKELINNIAIAVVKWVEYEVPDKGMGQEKFKMAADKLCIMLPFLAGRSADLVVLIENAVSAMDDELKKVK